MTEAWCQWALAARRAARVVVWSPPKVMIRGADDLAADLPLRPATTLCDFSSCFRATVLSRNVNGASPQSKIFAQSKNTFSPIRGLVRVHPASQTPWSDLSPEYMLHSWEGDMRLEPRRMPPGPNRAPGLAVTACRHQQVL